MFRVFVFCRFHFCLNKSINSIKLIMRIAFYSFIYLDYTEFADIRVKGNHRFLHYKGNRFYRKWEQSGYTYWMCSKYSRYRCDAKITTRTIDGYAKLKVTKAAHRHEPEYSPGTYPSPLC